MVKVKGLRVKINLNSYLSKMKKILFIFLSVVVLGTVNAQTRKTNKNAKNAEPTVTAESVLKDGITLYDSAKYAAALKAFETCIGIDSTCGDAYLYMASCHWRFAKEAIDNIDYFDESEWSRSDSVIQAQMKETEAFGKKAIRHTAPTEYIKLLKAYCLATQGMLEVDMKYIDMALEIVERHHLIDSCQYFTSYETLDINSPLCAFLRFMFDLGTEQADMNYRNCTEENCREQLERCIALEKTLIQHIEAEDSTFNKNWGYFSLSQYYYCHEIEDYDSSYRYLSLIDEDFVAENFPLAPSFEALLLYMGGHYAESVSRYATIIAQKKPEAWATLNCAFNRDFADLLTERLMKASDGFDSEDWFSFFQYLFFQNDYEKVVGLNQTLRAKGKNTLHTDYCEAMSLLHKGEYKQAEKCFAALTASDSDLEMMKKNVALAQFAQGKKKAAYKTANDLLTSLKDWSTLMTLDFMDGKYAETAALCKEKLSMVNPSEDQDEMDSDMLEKELEELGQEDVIEMMYTKAFSIIFMGMPPDKCSTELLYLLSYGDNETRALAWAALGEVDKAVKSLELDKDIHQRIPSLHKTLCAVYALAGQKEQALKELEKALELGFRDFFYLENDPLMQSLRELSPYNKLIKKYKKTVR